jgi:hypothetical protein
MKIQDMAWYPLWSAFMEAVSVFFGLYSIQLYERKVRDGVTVIPAQGGALVYTLFIMKEWNIQTMADVLDDQLHQYLCQKSITVTVRDESTFFRIAGDPGPPASLMSSDRGLELFIPPHLFAGPSYAEMEERWDAFARMVYLALR